VRVDNGSKPWRPVPRRSIIKAVPFFEPLAEPPPELQQDEYWVFPLPTPGPLEVFAEWSIAGIEESSIAISGDDVREAARHAVVLWS
jgi:hypothetical protein